LFTSFGSCDSWRSFQLSPFPCPPSLSYPFPGLPCLVLPQHSFLGICSEVQAAGSTRAIQAHSVPVIVRQTSVFVTLCFLIYEIMISKRLFWHKPQRKYLEWGVHRSARVKKIWMSTRIMLVAWIQHSLFV